MKSQDFLLMLKIVSLGKKFTENVSWEQATLLEAESPDYFFSQKSPFSIRGLADSVGVSKTEVSASLKRLEKLNLVHFHERNPKIRVNKKALLELIQYAVPYFFPAEISGITRGTPTSFAAPILQGKIMSAGELAYVWSDENGKVKGLQVSPLHPSVPKAIRFDEFLYNYLALVDGVRLGNPREKDFSMSLLIELI